MTQAGHFTAANQKLFDAAWVEYPADDTGTGYENADENFNLAFEQLNPGNTIEGCGCSTCRGRWRLCVRSCTTRRSQAALM